MDTTTLQKHLIAFNVLHGGLGDYGIRADGVRDDDGSIGPRTQGALSAAAAIFGLTGPTWPDKAAARVEAEVVAWPLRSASASLGFRALAFALREWLDGVKEEPMGSNSGPRIREYLAGCVRRRTGEALDLTASEWCAAAASWCVERAKREGERAPHGWRAAGAELETELKDAKAWRPIADVRAGRYLPRPGDLVITKRGSQAWQRHVCRLVAHRGEYLWTIGGNENNRWMLTPRKLASDEILGFGAYPVAEEDDARIAELCPGTAAKRVSEPICT